MTEPRWLTDEQQQAWRRFVEVLVKMPAALEAQLQRDSGLTHMGYLVLLTLSEREDRRLAMSKLAKRASASLSRLSHVVARLEEQGWARRERDPEDGRVQIAGATVGEGGGGAAGGADGGHPPAGGRALTGPASEAAAAASRAAAPAASGAAPA